MMRERVVRGLRGRRRIPGRENLELISLRCVQVEAAQRARNEARKTTGEESKPRYFTKQEDGMWVLNDVGWKVTRPRRRKKQLELE